MRVHRLPIAACLAAAIVLAACDHTIVGIGTLPKTFAVRVLDTSSALVSSGTVTMESPDGRSLQGTYELTPQVATAISGPLDGWVDNGTFRVDLGPLTPGGGVWFLGTAKGEEISGVWGYSRIGTLDAMQGTFSGRVTFVRLISAQSQTP